MKMGLAMAAVQPPVEVEVLVDEKNQLIDTIGTELAAHVNDAWSRAKFAKTEITERLLQCERQRRGVYDPDKAMDIAKTGGSDIYMRITDVKSRAAANWIIDVMVSGGRRAFNLDPAREPELPPEISAGIVDLVRLEMQEFVARSEEHTSELQSHPDLVCRLLLEIGRASCRERV